MQKHKFFKAYPRIGFNAIVHFNNSDIIDATDLSTNSSA